MGRRAAAWLPMSIGLTLACALGAAAQPAGQAQQPASTAQGLSMDSDQPVRIESNTLEVRDKIRQATFAGDVKLTQGDTIIKCKVLVVFYEDTAAPAKKAAPPATAGGQPAQKNSQKIKRAECKGDVFVVQKEQTATGENAVFEMKANTVVITGSVVLTQGPTVLRGDRMVANLTTGVTNVYSVPVAAGKGGAEPTAPRRVEFMMQPGASKDAKAFPAPAPPAPPAAPAAAPPPSAKAAPKGPLRLN